MTRRARWKRYWTATGVIPRWQLIAVYALIIGAGMIGFAITRHQAHRTDQLVRENRAFALRADASAKQAQANTAAIQRQRKELCKDQNTRHRKTIQTLNAVLANFIKEHPEQAKQVRDSVRSNVLIINALAPKRKCAAIKPNP